MDAYSAALMLSVGLALGALAAWIARGGQLAAEHARAARAEDALQDERIAHAKAETEAARVAKLEAELGEVRGLFAAVTEANVRLESARLADERAHAEKLATLTSLRGEIEKDMHAIAASALQGNQSSFLLLAGQAFETHQQAAANLLAQKEQAIANLLSPMAAALDAYQKGLSGFEKAHAVLASEVQSVGAHTRKLVTALQAAPKTRGRWGEQQLHNVMELSGMTAYIDFDPERTIDGDDSRLRPDIIIRLPGDRRIVVDAKTSMAAYLDAVEADGEAREAHLDRHARQLRTHMKQLAGKAYWEALPFTPDFVVMFIPGENFFAAAIERDPQLFEDAVAARVLIVTPTTLIALAKAIAFGWRQEKVADNARQIATLGRNLYRRLAAMGGHIVDLGKGLDGAVRRYNDFVGSLEQSVMPQARRFNELEVDGTQDAIAELHPIEASTRQIRGDRDLVIHQAGVIPLAAAERAHHPAE